MEKSKLTPKQLTESIKIKETYCIDCCYFKLFEHHAENEQKMGFCRRFPPTLNGNTYRYPIIKAMNISCGEIKQISEYLSLVSEIKEVEDLLANTPKDNIIEYKSLEARLKTLKTLCQI